MPDDKSERLDKIKKLREQGIDPYPYSFSRTHMAEQIKDSFESLEEQTVTVAGRIMSKRSFGKLAFLILRDGSGTIQVAVSVKDMGDKFSILGLLDSADFIGVKGRVGKTKLGEISVFATEITVLGKSLHSLPEKFHGLKDTELRYRKRYLDLIVNPDVQKAFEIRSRAISLMREYLNNKDFVELETPILQSVYGGAAAKPFTTYHNALDAKLFLRIADELYLKRLIIGGMERVYEFGKDFRNEDIDTMHNPEFTQVEIYQSYADYNDTMALAEGMLSYVVENLFGKKIIMYQGKELDFTPPFDRISFTESIKEATGIDVLLFETDEDAMAAAKKLDLKVAKPTRGRVIDAMFDHYVGDKLWNPTFILDYPEHMCPLAKRKRGNEKLSERFEMFIAGKECANSYSELTDPVEQRRKFTVQGEEREKGDEEAQPFDTDFLEAIEHGMPPTGGIGFGVDRVVMILADQNSIKEIIPFPSMRPLKESKEESEEKE